MCGIFLHFIRHVGVDIQRRFHRCVTNRRRQGLYIHTVLDGVRGERVPQIVESHVLASRVLQNLR